MRATIRLGAFQKKNALKPLLVRQWVIPPQASSAFVAAMEAHAPWRHRRDLVRQRAMTFFGRQPETPKPFPKTTNADLHAVLLDEPGLQFGKRRVGFAHHAGAKALVMRGKLRLGAARPRPRARLSGRPPPPQSFVDIRHADLEDRCRRIGTSSRFNRRHDPLAQILRVSSAHRNPPSNQQGKRITNKAPWESKRDSTRSENALAPKMFHESRAYDGGAHVFSDIFSHLAPASISSRARTSPCGLSRPRVRSRGSLAPIGWGKGDELDFSPGPVCWYVSALVSGLGSARGLVRVGWDRGAQRSLQKPSIQVPPASVDGRKALTAKGKKGLPRYNSSPIFLTACTNILIGNVSKTSVAHSLATCDESLTTPSCDMKSARSNSCAAAYSKIAVASVGRKVSIASQAKEYRPGFFPSWRNPKHGSYPLAVMMRTSRAAEIDTAKLCKACRGVSANRAVNCRGSSPDLPCRLSIYLVLNDRHCVGGLNPFAKCSSKSLHWCHHS